MTYDELARFGVSEPATDESQYRDETDTLL